MGELESLLDVRKPEGDSLVAPLSVVTAASTGRGELARCFGCETYLRDHLRGWDKEVWHTADARHSWEDVVIR